jgi:hypothetical protein
MADTEEGAPAANPRGNRLDNTNAYEREILRGSLRVFRVMASKKDKRTIADLITRFSELQS